MATTTALMHNRPDLLDKVAVLISEEWPMSREARLASLRKSCDDLPTCLVLLSSTDQPIGHVRVARVDDDASGVLIETVVVSKALRGKGYGRVIMEAAEQLVVSKGFTTLHLSTNDKQEFYRKLGFSESTPVTSLGSNSKQLNKAELSNLLRLFGGGNPPVDATKTWMKKQIQTN